MARWKMEGPTDEHASGLPLRDFDLWLQLAQLTEAVMKYDRTIAEGHHVDQVAAARDLVVMTAQEFVRLARTDERATIPVQQVVP